LLEISGEAPERSDIVSFEGKGKGEGKGTTTTTTTTTKEKGGDDGVAVASVPTTLAWERYIDELHQEQQWIEVMAMRSGLGMVFVNRFPEVLRLFKLTSSLPAMPSVIFVSSTPPAVRLSGSWWRSFRSPSTRGSTSTRIMILPRGNVRIAVSRYRRMLCQGRMSRRCGVMGSGCIDNFPPSQGGGKLNNDYGNRRKETGKERSQA